MDAPADPDGRWHAKDHLAHLAWWRRRDAVLIDAARSGTEAPAKAGDDTAQNAVIYAETKDRSAADIKAEAASSWSALRSTLESCSEDDLARPTPDSPENSLWELVPGLGGHVGVHLMFLYMEAGDVVRAEDAARWGYKYECSLLPEGEKRAYAAYNLACFYARAGRIDEALPLLRESISFKADLGTWALEDTDLDGIRDDPRVRELLGVAKS